MNKLSTIRLIKKIEGHKFSLLSLAVSRSIFTEGDYSKSFYIIPSDIDLNVLVKIYDSFEYAYDKKEFINQISALKSNDIIQEILAGDADGDFIDSVSDKYKLDGLYSLLKNIADRFDLEVECIFTNKDENYRIQHIFEMRDNTQITDQPIHGILYDIVESDNKGKLQMGDTIRTINGLECIEKVEDRIFITCDGNKYNMNEVERVVHKKAVKISARTIVDNMTIEEESR